MEILYSPAYEVLILCNQHEQNNPTLQGTRKPSREGSFTAGICG